MSALRSIATVLVLALSLAGCATPGQQAAVPANAQEAPERDELRAFAASVRAAFLAKDLDAFMSHFHADFRTDGRDKAAQREYIRTQVMPFVKEWEYQISDARFEGDRASVKAEFVTEYGRFPGNDVLIRENGRWLWYGNRK